MEPLQQRVEEVIAQGEDSKKNMARTQVECGDMISDEIASQALDTLREKIVQAQTKANEPTKKFHALAGAIEEVHKV